ITLSTPTSTSYLKIVDIPITDPKSKDWLKATDVTLSEAMLASPVGSSLADIIKHVRLMRTSPHSDSCIAWVDISDTVSGTSAKKFIGKFISVARKNCKILGARPHSGSVLCTRCYRWGHHSSQCRRLGVRCPLCGGPHREDSHSLMIIGMADPPPRAFEPTPPPPTPSGTAIPRPRSCVNCSAAGKTKRDHSATDTSCPFWQNRFDRDWLRRQFPKK
ncbi:hypothetical protein AGABI2DRAFT_68456, partial [Agaricus bisporus var. bisporus H97]|uniref:hypothetical protein n=1 Tax=Agaricus bisporus var. bisporus (strain H97 / ATCC MYA-4626 / FGSC 10389) TaxID=936046 RepID=UPI00029F7223